MPGNGYQGEPSLRDGMIGCYLRNRFACGLRRKRQAFRIEWHFSKGSAATSTINTSETSDADQTVPYGTDLSFGRFQAISCLATIILSLRDKNRCFLGGGEYFRERLQYQGTRRRNRVQRSPRSFSQEHVFDDKRRVIDDTLHKMETPLRKSERSLERPWISSVETLNTAPEGLSKFQLHGLDFVEGQAD